MKTILLILSGIIIALIFAFWFVENLFDSFFKNLKDIFNKK